MKWMILMAVLLNLPSHIPANAGKVERNMDNSNNAPYPISTKMLDNGMQIVVVEDRRAPVVTHMVWYKVGGADEPVKKSGIAHFLEHLMFKGTTNYPDGEFSKIVASLGGQENAFTSQDYTAYYQRVSKEHLPLLMRMEADRMTNLILSDDAVTTERDVVLEERKSRVDNSPAAQLGELTDAALFMAHPYGIPIIGWEHEIEQLNREDALNFYKQYYDPKNAILIVAGDVDLEEVSALAEDTYAVIPSSSTIEAVRERPQEPPVFGIKTVEVIDEKAGEPYTQIMFLLPGHKQLSDIQSASLKLFAQILGSGTTSHLYKNLVVEEAVATSAGAYFYDSSYDYSRFGLYGVPKDISLEEMKNILLEQLSATIENGVTDEELEKIKNRFIAGEIYAQDDQSRLARMVGVALTTGRDIDDIQKSLSIIKKVTTEDVKEAAQSLIPLHSYLVANLKQNKAD